MGIHRVAPRWDRSAQPGYRMQPMTRPLQSERRGGCKRLDMARFCLFIGLGVVALGIAGASPAGAQTGQDRSEILQP